MKTKDKTRKNSILFIVIGTCISALAGFHLDRVLVRQQLADEEKISTIYSERTESLINSVFHKTDVIAAAIKLKNGDISDEEFDTLAKLVYQENAGIRGIQLMPGAVVTNSYPLEGNEGVMGKNFLEIEDRKKDVMLAINTKSISLSGPYSLIQGGLGVVARNPIFLTDADGKEYFWGFSAIVLNLPDALDDAQLSHLSESGYDFQLFNINENGERIVIDGNENMNTDKAVCSGVEVPNHEWTLAISSSRPWTPLIAGTGTFLLGFLLTIVLWNILHLMRREKAAVQAKDEFFSNISHDMRTPLNAVLGFTRLAQSDELSVEEKDAYLQKIESSGNLLLDLVNDTLLLSKGSNGKIVMHPEPCSIHSLGTEIITPLRELAGNKEIQLIVDFSQCQDRTILVDRLYLEKIFLNLITNAVKYTPRGGHIWFSAVDQKSEEQKADILITIKDDGIGMSEEFQAHMFEPFMQENRPGYESNGTGLGLAIVKQTVDLMHGTMHVNSRINEGTEYQIELVFDLMTAKEAPVPSVLPAEEDFLAGKKVLICEDNALNREIAIALLKNQQMEVVSAVNGEQGVELFTKSAVHEFDAILMDLRMPVMDGIQAAEKIRSLDRKDARSIPIIAMTADVFSEDIQKCLAAGMNDHVGKPIDPPKLYETLARCIKENE